MNKTFLSFIFSMIWIMGCSCNNNNDNQISTISYYWNNNSRLISVSDNREEVTSLIMDLVSGTDDLLRSIVDEGTIEEVKQTRCIEIVFTDEISIVSKQGTIINFKKILVPFGDDFRSFGGVFYCADSDYCTPPYVNSQGFVIMEKLLKLCEKELIH